MAFAYAVFAQFLSLEVAALLEKKGLFTNFFRILGRRRPDCLRIFTGFWQGGFPIVYGFLRDFGEEASGCFRIVYGFLPEFVEEASGLRPDFYRILGRRLTDCLRICTGFWGGGFRIVYGFVPDFGEKASTVSLRTPGVEKSFGRRR